MERRRQSSFLSISVSAKSSTNDPKEDLRSGLFALDKSHLGNMNLRESSTSSREGIDEDAIDRFLKEEDVYTVDLKAYM